MVGYKKLYLFGYTRDHKGEVVNYHKVNASNTIHTFTGGGWITDQIVLIKYERKYKDRRRETKSVDRQTLTF